MCRATDKTYRLDTVAARAFLDDFVTLPESAHAQEEALTMSDRTDGGQAVAVRTRPPPMERTCWLAR
jgi:hypothetical protein